METALLATMAGGTSMSIASSLQQGKEAQDIANARAAIDLANAKAARQSAEEHARIEAEEGRRLLARQKAAYAAGNIKTNIGVPLTVEAQTQRDITRDIGFILAGGRAESDYYKSMAGIEKATGKAAKRRSMWDALSTGLTGFGSIAYMGYQGGLWGKGANRDLYLATKHGIV